MDSRVSGRGAASWPPAAGGGAASEESGCAGAGAHIASSIATIDRRVARMESRPDVGPQDFVLAYSSESSWTMQFWRKGWDSNPRGSVNPLAVFKTAALNRSAALPSF